ncbi:MAG: hypothetical protein IPN95_24595 [Bacteroidetes bacterium]|nr:hypothetical protein [Bacteroidota bacterium]
MGKAENIKRMRRQRVAKRAQNNPQSSGDKSMKSLATKELYSRAAENDFEIGPGDPDVKYSDLLEEFAEPIVDLTRPIKEIRDGYKLAVIAWNMASLRHVRPDQFKKDWVKFESDFARIPGMLDLMVNFLERKDEMFPEYNKIIVDFEVSKSRSGDGYDLAVSYA